jgi:hypothetical protein
VSLVIGVVLHARGNLGTAQVKSGAKVTIGGRPGGTISNWRATDFADHVFADAR